MIRRDEDRSVPPFSVFNTVFLLNGMDLYRDIIPEGRWRRRLCPLWRVSVVGSCWIGLIFFSINLPASSNSFLGLELMTLMFMRMLIQVQVTTNLGEIKRFIGTLSSELDGKRRRLLTLISLSLFMIIFMVWIVEQVKMELSRGSNELLSVLFFIRLSYFITISLIGFSMPLQCLTLILLYFHQMKRIDLIHHSAQRGRADVIFDAAGEMSDMFKTFERLFSIHPLTWLVYNFLLTTYILLEMFTSRSKATLFLFIVLYHQQLLSALFFFIILWVRERIRRHKSTIHFTYCMNQSTGGREMCPSLSFALEEAFKCNFTVYGIFVIDSDLIFSYFTTVLTFSVLTIQLHNGTLISK